MNIIIIKIINVLANDFLTNSFIPETNKTLDLKYFIVFQTNFFNGKKYFYA